MTALTLTVRANPIFLTGNLLTRYADQAGDLLLSSGVALRHRLYDMDPAGQWAGETASDASDETATFGLWLPGMQSAQDVDFLAVLGSNLKAFDWDLSDDNGATYPGANQQVITGQTSSYKITSLAAPIEADKVKLTMHSTWATTPNAFKKVGAIVVAAARLQSPVPMTLFKPHPPRVKDRTVKMYDNSTRRTFVYRSDASLAFRDFSVGFSCLTAAQADAMEAIVLGAEPFIFYPEPVEKPDKMYLGSVIPGTYTRDYVTLSKSGGEMITFDFEEAGGA